MPAFRGARGVCGVATALYFTAAVINSYIYHKFGDRTPKPTQPGQAALSPPSWPVCFDWEREAGLLNETMLTEHGEGFTWAPQSPSAPPFWVAAILFALFSLLSALSIVGIPLALAAAGKVVFRWIDAIERRFMNLLPAKLIELMPRVARAHSLLSAVEPLAAAYLLPPPSAGVVFLLSAGLMEATKCLLAIALAFFLSATAAEKLVDDLRSALQEQVRRLFRAEETRYFHEQEGVRLSGRLAAAQRSLDLSDAELLQSKGERLRLEGELVEKDARIQLLLEKVAALEGAEKSNHLQPVQVIYQTSPCEAEGDPEEGLPTFGEPYGGLEKRGSGVFSLVDWQRVNRRDSKAVTWARQSPLETIDRARMGEGRPRQVILQLNALCDDLQELSSVCWARMAQSAAVETAADESAE